MKQTDNNTEEPVQKSKPSRKRRPGKRRVKSQVTADETTSVAPVQEDNWDVSQFDVAPDETKSRFHDLDLPESLMRAIYELGFTYCTPIQAEILPSALTGRDAFGRAQTGTGKTAAFLITVITRMLRDPIQGKRKPGTPRVLIIAPTRELVLQISAEAQQLTRFCDINLVSVFGGMDYQKQKAQLSGKPVDIMVATPGRLLDFSRRRDLSLDRVEMLILDEADRMLDMGFIPDVRRIIHSTPHKDNRQTMLFSATLTEAITRLAASWTKNPVTIEIDPEQVAVNTVDQIVYIVTENEKFALLYNIITRENLNRLIIFCNQKNQVGRLAEMLTRYGIQCSELSGDIPQKKRIERLTHFKEGKIRVLVATDVAARGIHIEGMDHVVNFKLPHDPEDYIHRIGRTGRAGSAGTAISFADEDDAFYLPGIETLIDRKIDCISPDDDWLILPKPVNPKKAPTADSRKPQSRRKVTSRTRS